MKKLLLHAVLACQKMDVVNQQNVDIAIFVSKSRQLSVLQSRNIFVYKRFRRYVAHGLFLVLENMVSYGMHQMGLSQTYTAIYKKGIVGRGRRMRHSQRCSMGETVGIPHHKIVEFVVGVKCPVFP